MVWKVAIVSGVVVVTAAAIAAMALIPRSSGDGWRLDSSAMWEEAVADELDPTVTVYGSDATTVGIGVTVFGDPSCPPELRGVDIGDHEISVAVGDSHTFGSWTCNLGARPYQFGIVAERERLPDLPFDVVVVDEGRRRSTTRIDALP